MADTKISALTAATTLADTDELVIASAGTSKKISGANLKASMPAPGGWGAWELLSTTTIAGSAAAFDVSSIPGTHNDLLLMLIGRASYSASNDSVMLRFNNVSTSTYGTEQINGNSGTVSGFQQNTDTKISPGNVPASSAAAGWFGHIEILIPGYASTTWNKVAVCRAAFATGIGSGAKYVTDAAGVWNSTAAVNRVQLLINDSPDTFVIGSQLRIYGRL